MSAPLNYPELVALEVLMQSMLKASQNGEWTELSRMDEQRIALLEHNAEKQAIALALPINQDDASKELMEKIRKLDKDLIASVIVARDSLADENKVLRDQVKAKSFYQQASTMSNDGRR